jgi:leader peptidase (prepilin peptidase)/N-methyltransferase
VGDAVIIEPIVIIFAVVGSALGFAADALAHRWPAHEDDYQQRARFDWRTAVVIVVGAGAFAGLAAKFGHDGTALLVYIPAFAVFLALLATDLDQRVLPDVLTLPMIGFAAVVLVAGWSPALQGKQLGTISGVAAAVVFPIAMLVLDRVIGGELGFGDVKLSVSLGLLFGLSALFYGLLIGSIGFAVVLIVLMATRRIGLKSAIPFGPVLVFAAFLAALAT